MNNSILGLSDENLVLTIDGHRLLPEVAKSFEDMRQSAYSSGIDISICSSFRSFERQLSIWNKKFSGQLPLFNLKGETLNPDALNDEEKIHAIMLWSALPGASRHHWGTDFDVYDKVTVESTNHKFQLIPEEYTGHGPCARLSQWIQQYAQDFGFYFPYSQYVGGVAAEPWHMSFKNVAFEIERQFSLEHLKETLINSEILGKQTILTLLPELVERYTFNKGVKKI